MIYFTADTHFGEERKIFSSRRPFDTTDEMDQTMIHNWNKIVSKDDIIFHLGDFGNYEMVEKLNGRIYLILGNNERKDIDSNKITLDKLKELFYNVIEDDIIYRNFNNLNIAMMHKPENYDKSCFNLFGHIHGRQMIKPFGIDVGVDCHHFRPISIDDILFYKDAMENYYGKNIYMQE